jgi:branched-chain amino acid transport system substrate-binding protein
VEGCSETGIYGRLITETRRLVETEHVDAVVGAYGWSDAVVFRELARRYPTVPFIVAGSFAREATAHHPAANLYRFSPDAAQGAAGLATYAYRTLGWRNAATVAEQSPDGWGPVAAFEAEFCALGGRVNRIWALPFTAGPSLVRQVPPSVDGAMVIAGYGFAAFIRAYVERHPDAARSLLLDVRPYAPDELPAYAGLWQRLRGVVGHVAGVPDRASRTDAAYRKAFAQAFPGLPPLVAGNFSVLPYYTAVDALVHALETTNGEVGADRARVRAALASLRLATPDGPVRLDRNRQAIGPATLVQIDGSVSGMPSFHTVRQIPAVDETLGGLLGPSAAPGPATSTCRRAAPPPWAR